MNAVAEGPQSLNGSRGGLKGLAWVGGMLATAVTVVIGIVLAVFFAATVAVIALMGAALLGAASLAMRARRVSRARSRTGQPEIIEARHMGGHSWVAYGWDRPGR